MSLFGPSDLPEIEPSEAAIAQALLDVKREVRNRRIAMVAPVVLAAAVLVAFVAAPPQHGGLTLVPDAEASDDARLPQVFGANGVWRLAEPIGEPRPTVPGPPWQIDVPSEPSSPDYVLTPPDETDGANFDDSLPVSASTPPTPTLGQPEEADPDWADFQAEIRVAPSDDEPSSEAAPAEAPAPPLIADDGSDVAADTPEPAGVAVAPDNSSADEDVSAAVEPLPETTGDAATDGADVPAPAAADTGNPAEANPSTPQPDSADTGTQPSSAVATIVLESVLVHSAHVSVTVQVVDDDSSVIDWCNTRVDWGDGSVTGLIDPDGAAACAAPCEREAAPSEVGIFQQITFTHEYSVVIDAAPRIFVATGDGCSYTLAEFQLNPFTVVPY